MEYLSNAEKIFIYIENLAFYPFEAPWASLSSVPFKSTQFQEAPY